MCDLTGAGLGQLVIRGQAGCGALHPWQTAPAVLIGHGVGAVEEAGFSRGRGSPWGDGAEPPAVAAPCCSRSPVTLTFPPSAPLRAMWQPWLRENLCLLWGGERGGEEERKRLMP